jgi:hypothetical protein
LAIEKYPIEADAALIKDAIQIGSTCSISGSEQCNCCYGSASPSLPLAPQETLEIRDFRFKIQMLLSEHPSKQMTRLLQAAADETHHRQTRGGRWSQAINYAALLLSGWMAP